MTLLLMTLILRVFPHPNLQPAEWTGKRTPATAIDLHSPFRTAKQEVLAVLRTCVFLWDKEAWRRVEG